MRNYNRKKHLSAGRGAGRRLAVLAGAVMLAFASPLSVWAEEADKGGDTMESAVMVPAFPGGQEESQGTSEPSAPSFGTTDGTASSEPASSGSQTTEEGTATKIIRKMEPVRRHPIRYPRPHPAQIIPLALVLPISRLRRSSRAWTRAVLHPTRRFTM